MIPTRNVTTALVAHLNAHLDAPVSDGTAPKPAPNLYHVVEAIGGARLNPTLGRYAATRILRYRVRTVAVTTSVATSRQAAEHHADAATVAVMSRQWAITGTGWEVGTRELIGDSGTLTDSGPAANIARDYELHVTTT